MPPYHSPRTCGFRGPSVPHPELSQGVTGRAVFDDTLNPCRDNPFPPCLGQDRLLLKRLEA